MNTTQHNPSGEPIGDPDTAQQQPQSQPHQQPAQQHPEPELAPHVVGESHLHMEKPRPRTGPIVWGALFLVFCAYVVQRELAPGAVDTAVWIAITVIGLGVLLLAVGIAVVIRGAKSR